MAKGNALQAAKARIVTLEQQVKVLEQCAEQDAQISEDLRRNYGIHLNRVERRVSDLISSKGELEDSLREVQESRLAIQKSAAEQFTKDFKTIRRYQWLVGLAVVTFILQGINYVIG